MKLTNMTKMQETLHCWPSWWCYISAAIEGRCLIPSVDSDLQTYLQ